MRTDTDGQRSEDGKRRVYETPSCEVDLRTSRIVVMGLDGFKVTQKLHGCTKVFVMQHAATQFCKQGGYYHLGGSYYVLVATFSCTTQYLVKTQVLYSVLPQPWVIAHMTISVSTVLALEEPKMMENGVVTRELGLKSVFKRDEYVGICERQHAAESADPNSKTREAQFGPPLYLATQKSPGLACFMSLLACEMVLLEKFEY